MNYVIIIYIYIPYFLFYLNTLFGSKISRQLIIQAYGIYAAEITTKRGHQTR